MNFQIYSDFESTTSSNRVPEERIHINATKNMKGTPHRQEGVSIYFQVQTLVFLQVIPDIYHAYIYHGASAGHFQASFVSQPLSEASDLDALLIHCVLATQYVSG